MQVDVEHAFTAIEIGPEADSPQAAAFRQFWGQKAEMRKFLVKALPREIIGSGYGWES